MDLTVRKTCTQTKFCRSKRKWKKLRLKSGHSKSRSSTQIRQSICQFSRSKSTCIIFQRFIKQQNLFLQLQATRSRRQHLQSTPMPGNCPEISFPKHKRCSIRSSILFRAHRKFDRLVCWNGIVPRTSPIDCTG